MSENVRVTPTMKVRMATIPKSSFSRNLVRIARRSTCVKPLMMVESDDHPSPNNIVLCSICVCMLFGVCYATVEHIYHLIARAEQGQAIRPPGIANIFLVLEQIGNDYGGRNQGELDESVV